MSQNLPLLLEKLKSANEFLKLPERPSPQDRLAALDIFLNQALLSCEALLDSSWSSDFQNAYQKATRQCLKDILNVHAEIFLSTQIRPIRVGTASLQVAGPLWFRLLLEKLIPALALDNSVLLIAARAENSPPALGPSTKQLEALRELLIQSGFHEGAIQVLPYDPALHEFVYQHPGIKAHFVYLPPQHPERTQLSQTLSLEVFRTKKIQCFWGGKSVAAVLPGAKPKEIALKIIRGILEGEGGTPWNISRIVVVESLEKSLIDELQLCIQQLSPQSNTSDSSQTAQALADTVAEICKTQGRNLSPCPQIALLENISNCDESHQKELGLPLAVITSIKYPHEVNKWLGSLSNLVNLYCFGDEAKIKAVAQKSEAACVFHERFLDQIEQPLLHGHKESWWGQASTPGQPDSLFFWAQTKGY